MFPIVIWKIQNYIDDSGVVDKTRIADIYLQIRRRVGGIKVNNTGIN